MNSSGTSVVRFTIRAAEHVLKKGDNGSNINGNWTQIEGGIWRVTIDLFELDVLAGDGTDSICALGVTQKIWRDLVVHAINII